MSMSHGKAHKVAPEDVQLIIDVMYSEYGPSLEERREMLQERFGGHPIPKAIVDAALKKYGGGDPFSRGMMIQHLAELRGAEMLPWVDQLLESEDLRESGNGACALLFIDEARALPEINRLYHEYFHEPEDTGFSTGWFADALRERGTPNCLELLKTLTTEDSF